MRKHILRTSLLPLVIAFSGCAGFSEKFTSVEKVNLEPFATITTNMVNSIDYGLDRNSTILTKPYIKMDGKPELKRLIELDDELYRVLSGVERYSIKVVSLSSSPKTPKQKVEAFADYIDRLDKPALAYHIQKGTIQEEDLQNVLATIRNQGDLLSAMKAAQPMIDVVLQHVDSLSEEIRRQEIRAEDEIDGAIEKDYATELAYIKMLWARRNGVMKALILIDDYYKGRSKALEELNASQVYSEIGTKSRKVSSSELKQLEKDLIVKLGEIKRQLDLVEGDFDNYMKIHQELDELVKFHDNEIRKARGVIQLWSGAHSKMASGITDPAEWFDVTDPGSELFDILKSNARR